MGTWAHGHLSKFLIRQPEKGVPTIQHSMLMTQVDTTLSVDQERFKYAGLQGAMERFLLQEASHIASHFNALVTLLVHERGLARPDGLVHSPSNCLRLCVEKQARGLC